MNATIDFDAPRVPPPEPPLQPALPPPSVPPPLPPPPDPAGPTLSQILVGVGALLTVVAVGVFAAVTWSALGPGGQALVLIGATVGGAAVTTLSSGRGLRATAEAVSVVTAALALATFEGARDLLITDADPWTTWAIGCGIVALALTGLGHAARVRAPAIVALTLVQVCAPLALIGASPPVVVAALAALGLAVADAGVAAATVRRRPDLATLAAALAAVAWGSSVLVGAARLFFDAPTEASLALVSAAAAAAALALSPSPAARAWWTVGAASATMAAALALVGVSLALGAGDAFWFPVAVLVGGFAVWCPTVADDRLVAARAVAAGSAGLAVAVELARSIAAAVGPLLSDVARPLGWSASGRDLITAADGSDALGGADPTLTFLALIAATGLLVRWPPVSLALGVLAVAASGVLLDLSVVAMVGVEVALGIGLCLGCALDRRLHPAAGIAGLLLLVLGVGWSTIVATELVLGSLLVVLSAAVAAVLVAVDGVRVSLDRRVGVLLVGIGAAWLAGTGAALSFGALVDWDPEVVWLFATAVAMAGSLAGFTFDTGSRAAAALSDFFAVAAIVVGGLAAVALGDGDTLSLVLAGVTVTAVAHTLRPRRCWPAVVAAAISGMALLWVRLWSAEVVLVEAYTLPLAVVIGLLGWLVHRRGQGGGSWAITGPALLVAMVPPTVLALEEPGGLRSMVVIATAVVLLVAGAMLGWKAPVIVGASVATVVGLAELWPAVDRLPRWSVLASLGLALMVLGARIEEGKKGLARMAGRLSSMW